MIYCKSEIPEKRNLSKEKKYKTNYSKFQQKIDKNSFHTRVISREKGNMRKYLLITFGSVLLGGGFYLLIKNHKEEEFIEKKEKTKHYVNTNQSTQVNQKNQQDKKAYCNNSNLFLIQNGTTAKNDCWFNTLIKTLLKLYKQKIEILFNTNKISEENLTEFVDFVNKSNSTDFFNQFKNNKTFSNIELSKIEPFTLPNQPKQMHFVFCLINHLEEQRPHCNNIIYLTGMVLKKIFAYENKQIDQTCKEYLKAFYKLITMKLKHDMQNGIQNDISEFLLKIAESCFGFPLFCSAFETYHTIDVRDKFQYYLLPYYQPIEELAEKNLCILSFQNEEIYVLPKIETPEDTLLKLKSLLEVKDFQKIKENVKNNERYGNIWPQLYINIKDMTNLQEALIAIENEVKNSENTKNITNALHQDDFKNILKVSCLIMRTGSIIGGHYWFVFFDKEKNCWYSSDDTGYGMNKIDDIKKYIEENSKSIPYVIAKNLAYKENSNDLG
jgi:hypothetical protein